jgi:hypothetical protein
MPLLLINTRCKIKGDFLQLMLPADILSKHPKSGKTA